MKNFIKSYHTVIGIILILYLIPVTALCGYFNQEWSLFSYSLFFCLFSSIFILFILKSWESSIKFASREKAAPAPETFLDEAFLVQAHQNQDALAGAEDKIKGLSKQLEEAQGETERLREDKAQFLARKEELLQELAQLKKNIGEKLTQKEILINEYQQTINDQRAVIEKKQKQLDQLESKASDLTYEIKTLLQLAETSHSIPTPISEPALSHKNVPTPPPKKEPPIHSLESAQVQLTRCLNIAQKLTNSEHLSAAGSRFPSFPNLALDQRRLFENLQGENNSAIFVYSQKEKKLLFANRQVQQLLGWNPDKFIQIFDDIIEDGLEEWKKNIYQITSKENKDVRLVLKAKTGEDLLINCHMGLIPSGIFRNHVIGVLYSEED